MAELPTMMTLQAAAQLLSRAGAAVTAETLRRAILAGKLAGRKIGRYWITSDVELNAYATRLQTPQPPAASPRRPARPTHTAADGPDHAVDYARLLEATGRRIKEDLKKRNRQR